MRDMAQLRLQDEVTRLEGSLTCGAEETGSSRPGTTMLPPYVIPDGPTLCEHLTVVKQLATSSRFIIIIPLDGQLIVYVLVLFSFIIVIITTLLLFPQHKCITQSKLQ